MRINRFLALCGFGSRRKVEQLIKKKRVNVNGKICDKLSTVVDIRCDKIEVDNKAVHFSKDKIYLMLNKPKNYLVTSKDEFGRKTVFDLLPDFKTRLFPIGRLDKDSTGLLLMTNDGDFAQKILHPKNKIPKLYKVEIKGEIGKGDVDKIRDGVLLDNKKTLPCRVFIKKVSKQSSILKIELYQGRKRQIRRVFEKIGFEVIGLKRVKIGNLKIAKLPLGMWRFLNFREVKNLKYYCS